ncbi:MAG: DUF2442 domain-containing protein [Anaerolineae bacterium]|nr:DUF2442 domain-containing protein [Anaerolineae bacterium]
MTTDDTTPNDLNRPVGVEISDNMLRVSLADGRIIATPLNWYPRLMNATSEQLLAYELSPAGVHWNELDEDLSVAGMLQGVHRGDHKVKA